MFVINAWFIVFKIYTLFVRPHQCTEKSEKFIYNYEGDISC